MVSNWSKMFFFNLNGNGGKALFFSPFFIRGDKLKSRFSTDVVNSIIGFLC